MAKPRVVQVVINYSLHGQLCNNVLHFGTDGFEELIAPLLSDILACITSSLRPAVTEDLVVNSLLGRELFPVLKDPEELTPGVVTQGTGLPGGVSFSAYLFQIKTGLGGKSNRGRIYIPGTIENDVQLSRVSDAAMVKLVAFASCLANKFIQRGAGSSPWQIGVLSRKKSLEVGQTIGSAFNVATVLRPVKEVAVMRSRRIGNGN